MHTIIALLMPLFLAAPAFGQRADCTTPTDVSATIFIDKYAFRSLGASILRAHGNAGCVGEKVLGPASTEPATAYALTVWGDDEFTTPDSLDGMTHNEPIALSIQKPATTVMLDAEAPFFSRFEYGNGRLYHIVGAEFDTTSTRLMNELSSSLAALSFSLDSLWFADSLQIAGLDSAVMALEVERENLIVQAESLSDENELLSDSVVVLSARLTDSQATIDQLELDLADAQTMLQAALIERDAVVADRDSLQAVVDAFPEDAVATIAALQDSVREATATINAIRAIATSNPGRFRPICNRIGC